MDQSVIAVIGTGSIGSRHLEVLRRIDSAVPIAIPQRHERLPQLRDEGYRTARDLADAVEMGARLCIVASDTGQHLSDGLEALERGLELLVEKPMARDCREATCLNRRSKSKNLGLSVGCVLRFSESLRKFIDLLPGMGQVHSVSIQAQSYLPDWRPNRDYKESYSARAGEGGVLRDMVHEIDYAGWIFGWPDALQARVRNLGRLGIASDEIAELQWETQASCLISISLDYLTKPARRLVTARGEHGTLEWDGIARTVTMNWQGGPVEEFPSTQPYDDMYLAQACAFVDSPAAGPDTALATGDDGVRAMAVCDAARRASDSRREETVEYP